MDSDELTFLLCRNFLNHTNPSHPDFEPDFAARMLVNKPHLFFRGGEAAAPRPFL
jgi:hypothetical protein